MIELSLNKQTKNNISQAIGTDYLSVVNYDPSEEMKLVGHNIVFSKKRDLKKIGRGNPLLSRHKIRTIEDVEIKLSRIK